MVNQTEEYYERYWQKNYTGKVAAHPPTQDKKNFKKIISKLQPYIQGKGLDVGCGDGVLTRELSRLSAVTKVTGIDIAQEAVSEAKKNYPQLNFRIATVTKLPFVKDSFDFIFASELVEHILDTEKMFQEFNRVLKKGGRLLITTVDFNFLKKLLVAALFWDRYFFPTNPHIRFFTKATLEELLHQAGFQIIDYKWNGSYFGIMPRGQIVVAKKARGLKF